MIDISQEELITFAEAAKRLPRRRAGRKVNVSTLHRWCTRGCQGVRLEFLKIGGIRCTSMAALQRFFDALTERDQGEGHGQGEDAPRNVTVSRKQSIAAAQRRLGLDRSPSAESAGRTVER